MVLLGAGLHALHLCAVAALCCFPLCCANFESLLIFLVVGVGVIVHWLANTDDWSLRPLAEAHRGLPRSYGAGTRARRRLSSARWIPLTFFMVRFNYKISWIPLYLRNQRHKIIKHTGFEQISLS